jgi:hypothetical protein
MISEECIYLFFSKKVVQLDGVSILGEFLGVSGNLYIFMFKVYE